MRRIGGLARFAAAALLLSVAQALAAASPHSAASARADIGVTILRLAPLSSDSAFHFVGGGSGGQLNGEATVRLPAWADGFTLQVPDKVVLVGLAGAERPADLKVEEGGAPGCLKVRVSARNLPPANACAASMDLVLVFE